VSAFAYAYIKQVQNFRVHKLSDKNFLKYSFAWNVMFSDNYYTKNISDDITIAKKSYFCSKLYKKNIGF